MALRACRACTRPGEAGAVEAGAAETGAAEAEMMLVGVGGLFAGARYDYFIFEF